MGTWFVELVPPGWQWLMEVIWGFVLSVIVLCVALLSVAFFNWLERKVAGRTQDRLGPHRVGGRFGWLQSPADGIKLLCKEDLVPAEADPILFRLAPYIGITAAFTAFFVLPFADGWVTQYVNNAAFMVLAILGLDVFGTVLAGLSSGSKFSLLGGLRAAAQMVGYEVPLGMCVVIPVMCYGTMDLNAIGQAQIGWFWNWGIFANPFMFVTFFVFLVCATAGCNRAPFDLAEAESELVAGFMTEYSGFRWAAFFMGEYTSMVILCGLGSILFLGGWNGPIPWTHWVWLSQVDNSFLTWIGCGFGMVGFLIKTYVLITIMMWARWSLPRLRVDQVMTMCLKYCFPIAAAMFLGAMFWIAMFPNGVFACCGSCGDSVCAADESEDSAETQTAEPMVSTGSPAMDTYTTPEVGKTKARKVGPGGMGKMPPPGADGKMGPPPGADGKGKMPSVGAGDATK